MMSLFHNVFFYYRDVGNGLSGGHIQICIFSLCLGNKRYLERARMVVRVSGGVTRHRRSTKGSKITMRKYLKTLSRNNSLINTAVVCSVAEPPFPMLGNNYRGKWGGTQLCFWASALTTCFDREMYMKSGGQIHSMWTLGCVRTNQRNMNIGFRVLTMHCLLYIYIYIYLSHRGTVCPQSKC